MRRYYVMIALALATLGCEAKPSKPALAASPSASAAATSPSASAAASGPTGASAAAAVPSILVADPLIAGYGGVGPATPAPLPDTWVVLLIDIEAPAELLGVKVTELELLDKAGKVVARAKVSPTSIRRDEKAIADDTRLKGDFSETGTVPFNGVIVPGRSVRLHIRAPLDTRAESLAALPVRFRARLLAKRDAGIRVEGPLQPPWPTG